MNKIGIGIESITPRLLIYTKYEYGIAVVAHTDAATADLFLEGVEYRTVFKEMILPGENVIRLRSRTAKSYYNFELISPTPPELLSEMADLYNRLVQVRLNPQEMLELLSDNGF